MEPHFSLRCLGQPVLLGPGGQPVRFRTRKHLALLMYLAVEPRVPHHRDRLADLLWGGVPLTEGRHSLATAMSVLRARLGRSAFETSRDHVRLVTDVLELDLDRLRSGDVLGDEFTPPLEVAGFLQDFELTGATEFMYWRERMEAELLPLIRGGLTRQIDQCRRTGDFTGIEVLADRMLRLDDLSEEGVRAKMEARAFAGDRLTALRVYDEWERRLGEDLGASPSALIEGIAIRLRRRGWERPANQRVPVVPTDQWKGRAFVGRGPQYRLLYEGWERTRGGTRGHGFVLGDSGIGKSTLVERFTTAAGLEGAAVSRVQCHDVERQIPYAAVSSLIEGLLSRPGVSGAPPEALAELSRTVPEVRRRFPHLPPASQVDGEAARVRLADAVHEFVRALSEEHPVVLVVDDAHQADEASVTILHLLLRRLREEPVMLILALRAGELESGAQVGRLLDRAEEFGFSRIVLPPLTPQDAVEVIGSLLPAGIVPPSPTVRRALVQAAAGYPMVLELLVRDWLDHGPRCLALALGAMTTTPDASPVAAYEPLVDRIARSLDPTTRNVLNLAAVLGARMNDLSLYRLVDATTGETLAGLSRLFDLRLLRDRGEGVEFVNELVRARVYMATPSPVRKALHDAVANILLAEAEEHASPGLEVAWHLIRAGRPAESTPHLLRGAKEALWAGAPHETQHALSTALPWLDASVQASAHLLLAEALQEQGCWEESIEVLAGGGFPDTAEAKLLRANASFHLDASQASANELLDEALGILHASVANPAQVNAAILIGRLTGYLRDRSTAGLVLQRLQASAIDPADRELCAKLALAKAGLHFAAGNRAASRAELLAGKQLLEQTGLMTTTAVRIYHGLATLNSLSGLYGDARIGLTRAYHLAKELGNDTVLGSLAAELALCCLRLGDFDALEDWSNRSFATFDERLAGFREVQATYTRGMAQVLRGNMDDAVDIIGQFQTKLNQHAPPQWLQQAWHGYKADVLMLAGRHQAAITAAHQLIRLDPRELELSVGGTYARWTALCGDRLVGKEEVARRLRGLLGHRESLDALDHVEVVLSAHYSGLFTADAIAAPLQGAREIAGRLPACMLYHIERLGLEASLVT